MKSPEQPRGSVETKSESPDKRKEIFDARTLFSSEEKRGLREGIQLILEDAPTAAEAKIAIELELRMHGIRFSSVAIEERRKVRSADISFGITRDGTAVYSTVHGQREVAEGSDGISAAFNKFVSKDKVMAGLQAEVAKENSRPEATPAGGEILGLKEVYFPPDLELHTGQRVNIKYGRGEEKEYEIRSVGAGPREGIIDAVAADGSGEITFLRKSKED